MINENKITENDELKNIAQIEHSRHQSLANFITNALRAMAAHCFFPKKPSVSLAFVTDNQLTLC
ncbi:MAG: transposase [Duncaniella sp.]|nr:transposase [Duncaniella sp.]